MRVLESHQVFKKVHLSDKKVIFRELASEKRSILVRNEQDETSHLVPFRMDDDSKLYCALSGNVTGWDKPQEVVANFVLNEESYFFKTRLLFEKGVPYLSLHTDLFQLQRRANARLDLPDDYPAIANILDINGVNCFYANARVRDISAGGCRIFLERKEPVLHIGDKIKMAIHLGQRRPFQFVTEVRFAAEISNGQIFGAQFLGRDNITENRLLVLVMDLQRELYVKFGPTS